VGYWFIHTNYENAFSKSTFYETKLKYLKILLMSIFEKYKLKQIMFV